MISKELLNFISKQASVTDELSSFPKHVFNKIADEGLLKITLPGGLLDYCNSNTSSLLHLLKKIGSADLAVGRIYEGHINALYLIHLFGNDEQKKNLFADVTEHNALFGVWNTQANDGIRISNNGNGTYQLVGSKTFCSGAGFINRPLITGEIEYQDKKGWQMCIVPIEQVKPLEQDSSFWQPMGMKASVSYRMDFTGVQIQDKDLLGQPDEYYSQPVFSGGVIRFAAVQLGAAEALFDATKNYLIQLNRTQDAFQKARIAEMTWLVASGNQWLDAAGNNTDRWLKDGTKADSIVAYANMTRTAIEEICLRTMQLSERCVGARGLMRPNRFERIHRDLTFYLRQPATDASLTAIADFVFNKNIPADELWH